MKTRLYLTLLFFLFYSNLNSQDNPLVAMAKMPCTSYGEGLDNKVYKDIYLHDFHWASRTEAQMSEAERILRVFYRRLFLALSAFLALIIVQIALMGYFYWKMKQVYEELLQKNKHWTNGNHLGKIMEFQPDGISQDEVLINETEISTTEIEGVTSLNGVTASGVEEETHGFVLSTSEIEGKVYGNEVKTYGVEEKTLGNDATISGNVKTNNGNDRRKPTEKELHFTARIHQMMIDQQIYRDNNLSLESLARLLGVNRETVSRSINRTTGKNFTYFLNEYRINEAVRLLSNARNRIVNYDELSEQVGFNNRITFHRAFKQITGLPPNGFKKNS